jgi:threonine dehydrogenase-like Zn-dependent dehydrogenase
MGIKSITYSIMKALVKPIVQPVTLENISIEPKKDHLFLKVLRAGICRTDIYVSEGTIRIHKPIVIGHEFVGEVVSSSFGFIKGNLVAVNPLLSSSVFLGIDYNGCFSQFVNIPSKQCFLLPKNIDLNLAAFIEPIAASMAPLKVLKKMFQANFRKMKNSLIGIYGKNRISILTQLILSEFGFQTEIFEEVKLEQYDIVIECSSNTESYKNIIQSIRKHGTIICKSRNPNLINVNMYDIVKKELNLIGVYYASFTEAINFSIHHTKILIPIFGKTFSLETYQAAFEEEKTGNTKVFFDPWLE